MATTIEVSSVDRRVDADGDAPARFYGSARPPGSRRHYVLIGFCVALLSAAGFVLPAAAEESAPAQNAQVQTGADQSPWDRQQEANARQADAWFDNYEFRDGETIARL